MRISKSFVDKVEIPALSSAGASTQSFYRDAAIVGFGLRVTSGGAKSFIVEKRINGKVKRITLGRYGNLTVEQAKKEALALENKAKKAAEQQGLALQEQAKQEACLLYTSPSPRD